MVHVIDKDKYKDIEKYAEDFYPNDDFEISFIKVSLKLFFPECINGVNDIDEAIEGLGSNDGGIDAFLIDEKSKIMHFFQFKTSINWEKNIIKSTDLSYFFDLEKKLEEINNHSNYKVQDIINEYNKLKKLEYTTEFHFFTSYNLSTSLNRKYNKDEFRFYHLDDVYNKLKEYESKNITDPEKCSIKFYINEKNEIQEEIEIDEKFKNSKNIPIWNFTQETGKKQKTTIGLVNGWSIIELYKDCKQSIFTRNIRNFLGNKSINKDIIKTAEEKPKNFYFYNNGITITCKDYKKTGDVLELDYPQIINGAQTVTSIYNAYENMKKILENTDDSIKKHFEELFVMTRIIQTTKGDDTKFSESVTRYNNTQNKILQQDFYANDPLQVKIHELLERFGYFYENKRGSFELLDKDTKKKFENKFIDIQELLMLYNTFKNQDSGTTAKKSKLFETENFHKIFDKESTSDDNIKKMIIAFNLQQIIKDITKQMNLLKKKKDIDDKTNISKYTIKLNEILGDVQINVLRNNKYDDYTEEDCKKVIDGIEALKYPHAIISVVSYLFKKMGVNISSYYEDNLFYEKIQKNMFFQISKQINDNFRKKDQLGNIIHHFKTSELEKEFEEFIKEKEINREKIIDIYDWK